MRSSDLALAQITTKWRGALKTFVSFQTECAKAGFDCTRPFGRGDEIPFVRCAAKTTWGPARFQSVHHALEHGPMFYAALVEALGSDDGREVACALDDLRQQGKLARDRDGRYHLAASGKAGYTGIIGQLYHDPNDGT